MKTKRPSIQQLLVVIAEYNRAHELDLEEARNGAVQSGVRNEFLENLYFAAERAAACLRAEVGGMKAEVKK